jgi:hypothetical protein
MSKKSQVDNIQSQIPSHILQDFPRFFDFLEAYYEWFNQEGGGAHDIRKHLSYLNFEESIDQYVDFMKKEYLTDVPEDILIDKEMFIKWSRKFNMARGSHASYKFLFKLLFGEQNISIYLPKDNILKTSDGVWVSGESLMLLTHNINNLEQFQFQKITQVRQIYNDIFESATANVQRVRTKYMGRYIVTELSISNIVGEFKEGYPIKTDSGAEEWMIPVINNAEITNSGFGHQVGQRILIDNLDLLTVDRIATENQLFDTRISSFFKDLDIQVYINNIVTNNYVYDGRRLSSPDINVGDAVKVTMPSYPGYLVVGRLDDNQGIIKVDILDLPVAQNGQYDLSTDTIGSSFAAKTVNGFVKSVDGYYIGTKGQLSSNMYLQDSFFYQNFSYAIRTEQDFTLYGDIVKKILHPAGFALFGRLDYIQAIESLLEYSEDISASNKVYEILHKYGAGSNYNAVRKFKERASRRVYIQSNFDSLNQNYLNGEAGYNLESEHLAERVPLVYDYPNLQGRMNKFNWADYYMYIPQEYTTENDSGDTYFETGYVSTRSPTNIVINYDTIIVS